MMSESMTGFIRAEKTLEWAHLYIEAKSVNNRYLDSFIRLPENFRYLESE